MTLADDLVAAAVAAVTDPEAFAGTLEEPESTSPIFDEMLAETPELLGAWSRPADHVLPWEQPQGGAGP